MITDNLAIGLRGFDLVDEIKITRSCGDPRYPEDGLEQMIFMKTGSIEKLERLGDLFLVLSEGVRDQLEYLRSKQ